MQPGTSTTSALSHQQIAQMNALMDELLDLPTDQRLAVLQRRAIDDPAVAAAVARWLEAVHASSNFMSTSPRTRLQEHPPDSSVGVRLGAWRLTRLIGRGGMGDVYEGMRVSGEFEQRVAVKLLKAAALLGGRWRRSSRPGGSPRSTAIGQMRRECAGNCKIRLSSTTWDAFSPAPRKPRAEP
jgi:hypothetical protein